MSNAFNPANYPTTEPTELVAGDRIAWKRTDLGLDYPPASYSLKYSARLDGAASEIEINAVTSGSDFLVEIPKATTAVYTPGRYSWQAYITRTSDSERVTVDSGTFEVKPNRDSATTDPRSHARKVLAAIEAVIENRASVDQMSVTLDGRSLDLTPISDLLVLRDRYREEARSEIAAERVAAGLGDPRRVGVRFQRV
jgi:hypothetical protein